MAKNIIFIPCVPSKHLSDVDNYKELSLSTWRHYANRIGAELMIMDTPLRNPDEMKITWQRWYVLEILEKNDIEYDQVLLVDADSVIHPDCPNFFELSENKFCAVHNDGSYDWVCRSYENYSKHLFEGFEFSLWEYFNSGFLIMNRSHKQFYQDIIKFYFENYI